MRCHHQVWNKNARADSTHDVHHAIVGVNVVIGVLVVHCELLVVRVVPLVVCDDAVVRRTLVLVAVAVAFVFVVAIFHRICCVGGTVFTASGSVKYIGTVLPFYPLVPSRISRRSNRTRAHMTTS